MNFESDKLVPVKNNWHKVMTTDKLDISAVALWSQEYETTGLFHNRLGKRTWYFEHEKDALIFKLKFG